MAIGAKARSSESAIRSGNGSSGSAVLPSPLFRGAWACLQNCNMGLAFAGRNLRLIFCNTAFSQLCKKAPDELIDKQLSDIFPDYPQLGRERNSEEVAWNTNITSGSFRVTLKEIADIGVSGYMISIQPISAPENQPALIESGIRRNFTSYEGRDHFLAVLEHELRSPLMPILAWIEVLKQEPNPSSGLQRALQAIERNVMRQRALVDDLLDLASIRNGKLECEQLPESIHQILSESVSRYETPARNKGVKLEFSVNSKDAFVLGDRRRLSQICDNLLDNAVKFTPGGGRIGVRLSVVDKWIRLDVQDNGIGISPQFIADVFKSFTQGHSLASAHRRGLGLGLAIVKDLVERHHGRVEAFSEGENRGAKFSVHLPLHTTSGVDMPTPTPLPRPGKVLIVEDGEDTREAIRMLLESWGLSIAEAEDGAAGLRQIEQFQPDVVLCDLSMPVMDGWTMASEIRNRYPSRNIPLIALTGHGSASDVQQSLACGFQAHLVKPCEAKNMIAVLNQFLPATAIKIDPKNE